MRYADVALRDELFELLAREGDLRGRRVLDVGCGTGTLLSWLAQHVTAKAWGVDPSEEMLAVARAKVGDSVGLKRARAEELPFKNGWFERVVMTLVVHHLDRPRAFAEFQRVLAEEGRLAIATFDPAQFEQHYLNAFFPSIAVIDRERFGTPDALVAQLEAAGFVGVTTAALDQVTHIDRDYALSRIKGKHISTFELIPDDEYTGGVERAERELPERVEVNQHWLVLSAHV
ncbi:MAG: class I SAM-dependent methyltransferase [Gaiellaceae bacterium]